ncbi:hypothetical protein QAD02_007977 [Eretmocerus hayati]|uniref:Uncharacterized protein n=1 Tax=Eretmocerus hayati TaxID=131215 RepID=A0ACC2N9I1_9HYME|nr:hypothetical protein QAD02_007977 [Eretmocerus hayati]
MAQNVDTHAGLRKELQSNFETYKTCFVPQCRNTSVKTPDKIFLTVPKAKRKLWFEAVGHPDTKKMKSNYCCQDHFDLKNDLQNYETWMEFGGNKKLKPTVVPRVEPSCDVSQIPSTTSTTTRAMDSLCSLEISDTSVESVESCATIIQVDIHNHDHSLPHEIQFINEYKYLQSSENDGYQEGNSQGRLELVNVYTDTRDLMPTYHKPTRTKWKKNPSVGCFICSSWKNFFKNVPIISKFLQQFIVWPSDDDLFLNLPIQFRYRYHNVRSIIDCFEIEIEKPSNAVHQALTWSDYKKCNTDKYFINISGDGLITFVSKGVPGRCSDMSIVENWGYLDKLTPNSCVLADRGFKHLDALLHKKECHLIRPPSVMKGVKNSKSEVKLAKQVASLRIHVERAINRIKNFRILDIHSRVDNDLVSHLDSMVNIACGLVNLQTSIIRQTEME